MITELCLKTYCGLSFLLPGRRRKLLPGYLVFAAMSFLAALQRLVHASSVHSVAGMSSTFIPWDASSTGFNAVLTYLHCTAEEWSNITETRLATKTWNLLPLLSTYRRTQVLWVQRVEPCVSNSYLILRPNLVAKATADSSVLAIVIALSGANLDFATSREQWKLPDINERGMWTHLLSLSGCKYMCWYLQRV